MEIRVQGEGWSTQLWNGTTTFVLMAYCLEGPAQRNSGAGTELHGLVRTSRASQETPVIRPTDYISFCTWGHLIVLTPSAQYHPSNKKIRGCLDKQVQAGG